VDGLRRERNNNEGSAVEFLESASGPNPLSQVLDYGGLGASVSCGLPVHSLGWSLGGRAEMVGPDFGDFFSVSPVLSWGRGW
jgi:hypothetical protein